MEGLTCSTLPHITLTQSVSHSSQVKWARARGAVSIFKSKLYTYVSNEYLFGIEYCAPSLLNWMVGKRSCAPSLQSVVCTGVAHMTHIYQLDHIEFITIYIYHISLYSSIHTYIHTYIPYHTIPYHTIPYHTIPYHTIHRYIHCFYFLLLVLSSSPTSPLLYFVQSLPSFPSLLMSSSTSPPPSTSPSTSPTSVPNVSSFCPMQKWKYEKCFQKWYVDEYLTGKSKTMDGCQQLLTEYQICVKVRNTKWRNEYITNTHTHTKHTHTHTH